MSYRSERAVVIDRAQNMCELPSILDRAGFRRGLLRRILMVVICGSSRPHVGVECHHRWPEDRETNRHDARRMLLLCRDAHTFAHNNQWVAGALGMLRGRA